MSNSAFSRRLVCLGVCLSPLLLAGAEWPQFRGPGSRGASGESSPPTTWDDATNIVWKADLPGPGSSSPIIFGDRVYITAYSGYVL